MAKVKVTTRFRILEFVDRFIDGALARDIGTTVSGKALEMIGEGQSPVRGHGRFERYKDRFNYPNRLKPHRPVNLNLTGDMLRDFGFQRKGSDTIEVGFIHASQESIRKARFHNAGTAYMAMRRIIPQAGEEWAVRIMRAVRDLYGKRLAKIIRDSNK